MTLQSFETRRLPPTPYTLADGPVLVCAPPGAERGELLRIRARRLLTTTPDELFAAWTRRAALESWLRLRARSRATVAAKPGASFRLELA
jgi:activator of Hsp90 ATPase-like protein